MRLLQERIDYVGRRLSVGVEAYGDLLGRVDPYDVQVAEVDALLVQESGAGAALGPHMDVGGGGGCLSSRYSAGCN